MNPDDIAQIVDKHRNDRGGLISTLEEIQARYGYLPEKALRRVAEQSSWPLVDVYGVATFYKAFSLKPRGKHLVVICMGTACHVRGAPALLKEFSQQLGVAAGQTTADREFTLETVNCLGACALGPTVVVDGRNFPHVSPAHVKRIIDLTRQGLDKVAATDDKRIFPVEVSCSRCNHSLMDPQYSIDGHPSVRVTVAFNGKHGWLRLSSLYGSFSVETEFEAPLDTVVNMFCPHCHTELLGSMDCPECGARMVPMIVRGGGVVQICPRRGCRGHLLDVG